jgi:uncharacterized protein (DUF488 family)
MKFFTIGYGGRSPTDFVNKLLSAGVKTIADVRLRPDRASMGYYSKAKTPDKGIEALLSASGVGYVSLVELGNVFLSDPNWPQLYQELIDRSGELLTRRISAVPGPFCLMCAEKKVVECHRRIIADFLVKQGHEAVHLE